MEDDNPRNLGWFIHESRPYEMREGCVHVDWYAPVSSYVVGPRDLDEQHRRRTRFFGDFDTKAEAAADILNRLA